MKIFQNFSSARAATLKFINIFKACQELEMASISIHTLWDFMIVPLVG